MTTIKVTPGFALIILLAIATVTQVCAAPPTPGAVRETLPKLKPIPQLDRPPEVVEVETDTVTQAQSGGVQVIVKRFEISGNTIFSTDKLLGVIADYAGRPLSLSGIYEAADTLTKYYRNQGYSLTTVNVPVQNVSSGLVKFEVIEGQLGSLLFEGNESYSDAFMTRQLDELKTGDVITSKDLEHELYLLNDIPGLSSRAVIKPGASFGSSDIIIRSREDRFEAKLQVDNHGRTSVGEWRVLGDFTINNPLRFGDQLSLTLLHGEAGLLDYGSVSYGLPVNNNGTRLTLGYSRNIYHVETDELGAIFAGTELKGDSDYFSVDLTHPLLRGRGSNLWIGLGLNRTLTKQSGTLVLPEARSSELTLFELSAFGNHIHEDNAISSAYAILSTNFDNNSTGLENNAQGAKFELGGSYLRLLKYEWVLRLRGNGVVTTGNLMDISRFRIGGPDNVRGFPAAELSGDQGVYGSIEFQRQFQLIQKFPVQFSVFYDAGVVHRKDPFAGVKKTESLTSVGMGLSFQLFRHYEFELQSVIPTNSHDVSDGRESVRLWAAVSANF